MRIPIYLLVLFCAACSSDTSDRRSIDRPTQRYNASPRSKNVAFDSLNIVTTDGVRLTGWLIRPRSVQHDALIILAGGDAGNMSYALDYATYMTDYLGVPILLFDYRGFGTSEPFTIDPDRLTYPEFLTDIESVVEWAGQHHPQSKIILQGLSMGASLSLIATSKHHEVAGVIAESPYISQRSIVERINAKRQRNGDARIVTYDGGETLDPMSYVNQLNSTALLLIHGANETQITPDEVKAFFRSYEGTTKELWLVPNAGHLEAMRADAQTYMEKVKAFVSNASVPVN